MNPTEFIKIKLHELHSKFEGIKIRYENRKNTNSHIVEVVPLNFFNENKNYMIEEERLENEFETLFPLENIVFVSHNSLTKIKKADLNLGYEIITVDYSSKGKEFEVSESLSIICYDGVDYNFALAA